MFVWGLLKRGIPESVRFCIGDLPMYIFFIPTHPYMLYNQYCPIKRASVKNAVSHKPWLTVLMQ